MYTNKAKLQRGDIATTARMQERDTDPTYFIINLFN